TNQTVGSVIGYNFAVHNQVPGFSNQVPAYNTNHGPHCMMVLWEGNIGAGFQNDGYHGSGSHITVFRNLFNGIDPFSQLSTNRKPVDLCRFSYFHNVVGNVLGDPSWTPQEYEMSAALAEYTDPVIYRLGFPNVGNDAFVTGNPPQGANGN